MKVVLSEPKSKSEFFKFVSSEYEPELEAGAGRTVFNFNPSSNRKGFFLPIPELK